MRKLVVVALAVAIAAMIAFWRLRSSIDEPLAPASIPGAEELVGERAARAEHATATSVPAESRAPATGEPSAADAPPAPDSPDSSLAVIVVTEEDGAGLPSAKLNVTRVGDRLPASAKIATQPGKLDETVQSGAFGRANFALPAGVELVLSVRHPALLSVARFPIAPLARGERRELRVAVRSHDANVLRARVVDEPTGRPIADARASIVVLANEGMPSDGIARPDFVAARTRTDATGAFELPFAPWRHGLLQVDAAGHGRRLEAPEELLARVDGEVVIALPRSARLEVHAIGVAQQPGAELLVGIAANELALLGKTDWGAWAGSQYWTQSFDAVERAELADVPARANLWLAVRVGDRLVERVPTPLRLEPGETRALELTLGGGARLLVDVRKTDGTPAAKVELTLVAPDGQDDMLVHFAPLNSTQRTTDEHGRAVFESVAPGTWLIVPRCDASAPAEQRASCVATRVLVAPDVREVRAELTLELGVWLRGHVEDARGESSDGEFVFAWSNALGISLSGTTERDGSFEFGPLAAGRYELVAGGYVGAQGEPLSIVAPAENIWLKTVDSGFLRVRLVDREGAPVRNAEVLWKLGGTANEAASWWSETPSDEFAFDNATLGPWDVVATTADGLVGAESIEATAEPGAGAATLTLAPGARLTLLEAPPLGTCIATRGDRLIGLALMGRGAAPTIVLPAGHAKLTFLRTGEPSERSLEVDVVAGETRDVDMSLAR